MFGLGAGEVHHFERKAAEEIASKLNGEHRRVAVRTTSVGLNALTGHFKRVLITASNFSTPGLPLFTEPNLSQSGRIDDLRIELSNFYLGNLHIERLSSSIPNCRYDFGLALSKQRIRVTRSGSGRGKVEIGERDLESFILKKFQEIKTLRVTLQDGRVRVAGHGEFLGLSADFEVVAFLRPANGSSIVLSDAAIALNGKPADELSKRALLGILNPVVDFNRDLSLYGAILVDKITLANGTLRAEGVTRIPNNPYPESNLTNSSTDKPASLMMARRVPTSSSR